MSDYLISVIVPCFNYARFLPDAVNSLIGGPTCLGNFAPQTFQNFDIWIINDASTDDTDAVGKSLVSDRVHYFSNEQNLGTAATLNVGIRQAKGKYITFLSADDMMETTRLEKLYRAIIANPHRIVYDDIRIVDGKGRGEVWPMSEYDFDKTLYKNQMHAGILYPRQAWEECSGYPEIMRDGREDWAFGVALGVRGWCGVHVKEALYLYRRDGQNRSLKNTGAQWRTTFLGRMQSLYPNLYRGERPAMCCGNGNKPKAMVARSASRSAGARGSSARPAMLAVGEAGMRLLEYQLPKSGYVQYVGAATGQAYVFDNHNRKRGYVDSRDAQALLDRIEDRRHAFVEINEPQPQIATPPTPEEVHQPEPVGVVTQEIDIMETVEVAEAPKQRKPRKSA